MTEFKVYFTFCTSKAQFRRSVFYGDFPDCGDLSNVGSLCCDTVCAHLCVCEQCDNNIRP